MSSMWVRGLSHVVDTRLGDAPRNAATNAESSILEIRGLHLRFGGIVALANMDLIVKPRELVGIIGPNGAGKTSLVNCITGVYRPTRGTVTLGGVDLSGRPPYWIVRAGIARTFQHVELVRSMSVEDNLLTARHQLMHRNLLWTSLYYGPAAREEHAHRDAVMEILRFLDLEAMAKVPAGSLPLSEQKLVALGRALASEPKVLLLDEPSSGLAPEEKDHLGRALIAVKEQFGVSQIIVEHDLPLVRRLCERIVVMNFGEKLAEGSPEEVLSRPDVMTAYLGAQPV
jgi:branched-chain amino acid transport system ATP-binding protein